LQYHEYHMFIIEFWLLISICQGDIHLQRFCNCPKLTTGFPTPYVVIFFAFNDMT
jgi:hypothetical protein